MPSYTVHFVDHDGNSYEIDKFDCVNDDEAVTRGHKLKFPFTGAGFDIWDGKRLVHQHRSKSSPKKS